MRHQSFSAPLKVKTKMTDDLVDSLLRCGLYFGAVFQIICIAAAVVIPDKMNDFTASYKEMDCGGGSGGGGGGGAGGGGGGSGGCGGGSEDEASDRSTPHATPRRPAHAHAHVHHRPRKQEKKKRR